MANESLNIVKRTLDQIRDDEQLQYTNFQVLMLVQASLGLTGPFQGIALSCEGPKVTIDFYLTDEGETTDEAIEDIICNFESFQIGPVPISLNKIKGLPNNMHENTRFVFRRNSMRG